MNILIGAKFRPAMDTEAAASLTTLVLPTSPWASALPLAAWRLVGPSVPGAVAPDDEAPHDGPSQTAPDVAVPEPPAVTETLCVWVTLMGPWLVVPPGTTLLV
jgi:hypothetical protein